MVYIEYLELTLMFGHFIYGGQLF